MNQLQRHRQLAFGQFVEAGIQALAQTFGIQVEQALGIQVQVTDNQVVFVARVPGQRQHHPHIVARGRKTSGNIHQRLQQAYLVHDFLLAAQLK
ncbi:hypothetical protein D9M69_716220 [compost metagenome]